MWAMRSVRSETQDIGATGVKELQDGGIIHSRERCSLRRGACWNNGRSAGGRNVEVYGTALAFVS